MNKPYFFAKIQNNKVETKGEHSCLLGHKIDYTPGRKSDGIFAEWAWDGNQLTVENDRYGYYPLYYYWHNDEVCLSPSIRRLLAEGAPTELDYTALSVFLRLGFYIGEDTPFKYIRALPANTKFRWRDGRLEVSGDYCCTKEKATISYDEAIDKYIHLFHQSMKRRLPSDEKFAVPITGGRDSRHILFELDALGYRPEFCITIQKYPPSSNDHRVGRLIAERLKLKHVALDYPRLFLKNEMRRNLETNFCSDELRESADVTDHLIGKTNIYYDGIAGDALSTDLACSVERVELYEQGRFNDLASLIFDRYRNVGFHDEAFEKVFRPEFSKKISKECAINHLTNELKRHFHTPNPSAQFWFWNRTRREISLSPYAISSAIPTIYSPYLDHDLYDFFSSLDARSYILKHDFHTETIARAYPKYADIPYEDSKNSTDSGPILKKYNRSLLLYLLKEHKTVRKVMNLQYIIPRLIKYSISLNDWWISPTLIHYITHFCKIRAMGKKQNI